MTEVSSRIHSAVLASLSLNNLRVPSARYRGSVAYIALDTISAMASIRLWAKMKKTYWNTTGSAAQAAIDIGITPYSASSRVVPTTTSGRPAISSVSAESVMPSMPGSLSERSESTRSCRFLPKNSMERPSSG